MKRFLLIIGLVMCLSFRNDLNANPIIVLPPQAFLSELVFNPSHNWTLELEMFIDQYLPTTGVIDSIVLRSNTSRARLLVIPAEHFMLFNITAADLNAPFTINYLLDTLRVITYADSSQYFYGPAVNTHMLVFGYPTCEIPTLLAGQSISAREKEIGNPLYFYLDNSPTIGLQNDTTGATTHLTGRFYDARGHQVTYVLNQYGFALPVNVELHNFGTQVLFDPIDEFGFDPQGNYSTTLLSRNNGFTSITYLYMDYPGWGYFFKNNLPCSYFSYFREPGESMMQDIHLSDSSFFVGVNDPSGNPKQEISIICAPNPVSQSGTFFISSDKPVEHAEIVIHAANGSIIHKIPVPRLNKSSIAFSRGQLGAPGLYFFTLLQNGKAIKSGEIICR